MNRKQSLLSRICDKYSFNNLGSIWYCIVAACFQIYIIIRSIYRFSAYISLPWPNATVPENSINSYMLFIGASIILLPFFIVVALIKIGNYSNDGRKIGSFSIARYFHNKSKQDEEIQINWLRLIWKHSLPIAPFLHLLIAICFLFPRLITEAQLIRHGFLSKGDIWKTDLDFLLDRFNGKMFNFFGLLRTINTTEHRAIVSDSATLGQYFIRNTKSLSETFYELDESGKFSLEFFNFITALFVLVVRYPAVFWHVNKPFALIFIFQLLVNFAQSIIAFNAFQVAFKIFVCDPTHLLIRFRESSSLNLGQLSIIFLLYLLVLQFSSIALYMYGIQKYREYRYVRTKYFQLKYESQFFAKYLPYIAAMGFFLLFAILIGPLFYEFVIIYCGSLNISALLIITSIIGYFTIWIVLWVCLALKTVWTFNYEDFEWKESLLDAEKMFDTSALVVICDGKTFRVNGDAAKQAIVNFVQESNFPPSNPRFEEENYSNVYLDRSNQYRQSAKSFRSERLIKNTNCRYSMRNYKTTNKEVNFQDGSDSEGEYTTFRKLKRTYSLNHKSCLKNKHQTTIQMNSNSEPVYKSTLISENQPMMPYNYEFEPCNLTDKLTTFRNTDKSSDTSSGIHSDGSQVSMTSNEPKSNLVKSNSLESLMQRLEAAKADKPNLRSLNPLQRSIHLLNHYDSEPESGRSYNTENAIYGSRMNYDSKLVEFTENPDYSKYYSLSPPQDLSV